MMSPGAYTSAVAVTPNDSTVLAPTAALYIGGAGNVAVVMAGEGNLNVSVTFTAPPVGTILPLAVKKVMATGTTATLIVALR